MKLTISYVKLAPLVNSADVFCLLVSSGNGWLAK